MAILNIIAVLLGVLVWIARIALFVAIFVLVIYGIKFFYTKSKLNCSDCPYRKHYDSTYNQSSNDYKPFQ